MARFLFFFIFVLFSCKDNNEINVIDLPNSGKWHTISITTTNYDENDQIVELKPIAGTNSTSLYAIADSLQPFYSMTELRYSLEFLTNGKLRISTVKGEYLQDYDYQIESNSLIINYDQSQNIVESHAFDIQGKTLTLKLRRDNSNNPVTVNSNIKYSIEEWKLKQ